MDEIDRLMPDPPPRLGPETRPGAWDEAAVRDACQGRPSLLLAAVLLWHDHLDAAHALCQAREGDPDADLVHAILHRREPDAGNSRYWYARVGVHPVFAELAAAASAGHLGADLAPGGTWDPRRMIAACSRAGNAANALEALQALELRALARHLAADGR